MVYRSMNSPTLQIGKDLGLSRVQGMLKFLNSELQSKIGSILGSSNSTMMEMNRLYGIFANNGTRNKHSVILSITDRTGRGLYNRQNTDYRGLKVLSSKNTFLVREGMRMVLKYGTGHKFAKLSPMGCRKTGTSNMSVTTGLTDLPRISMQQSG